MPSELNGIILKKEPHAKIRTPGFCRDPLRFHRFFGVRHSKTLP